MSFQGFKLHAKLLGNINKAGFTEATPVQAKTIPLALQNRDIMACAQTGTGKTAAFVLPLAHKLLSNERATNVPPKAPRALILTPTRELAGQVLDNINLFIKGTDLKANMVVGGVSFPPQLKMLNRPLDILVATPGRLIDHMQQGTVNLKGVETIILDEADRMLDMGFLKPVERIMSGIAAQRQTLLFSATFDAEIEKLSKRFLNEPSVVKLASSTQQHAQITQSLYYTEGKEHKADLLKKLLDNKEVWQAVVFMKTKHATDKMAKRIQGWGHDTAALNGNMKQNARKRVIDQMHKGKLRVLVATDVAARGIDVKDITHVFNFDLPQVAEDYIHRIGRTGRAGATGEAVSFISVEEYGLLRDIEKLMQQKIKPLNEPSKPLPSDIPATAKGFGNRGKKTGKSSGGASGRGFGGGKPANRAKAGGFKFGSGKRKPSGSGEGGGERNAHGGNGGGGKSHRPDGSRSKFLNKGKRSGPQRGNRGANSGSGAQA